GAKAGSQKGHPITNQYQCRFFIFYFSSYPKPVEWIDGIYFLEYGEVCGFGLIAILGFPWE
ncbi:hypothetical protein ABTL93_19060, partial [Acinetobacter baumannii]